MIFIKNHEAKEAMIFMTAINASANGQYLLAAQVNRFDILAMVHDKFRINLSSREISFIAGWAFHYENDEMMLFALEAGYDFNGNTLELIIERAMEKSFSFILDKMFGYCDKFKICHNGLQCLINSKNEELIKIWNNNVARIFTKLREKIYSEKPEYFERKVQENCFEARESWLEIQDKVTLNLEKPTLWIAYLKLVICFSI